MLDHADGFDWIPTAADDALLADRYDLVDANVTIDDSLANVDWENGLTATSSGQRLRKVVTTSATRITGFHFVATSLAAQTIFRFLDSGTVQGSLRLTADGRIAAYSGDAATLLGQSDAGTIVINTVYWIECKYLVSSDADVGFVVVGIDDVAVVSVRAVTQIAGATINQVELVADLNVIFDDWMNKNILGSTHNDFGGEAYVELTQVSDELEYGGYEGGSEAAFEWVNSAGNSLNNNIYVDEVPTSAPDDDTSYVHDSGSPGDIDTYRASLAMLEGTLSITIPLSAVSVLYRARLEAPGSENFAPHEFQPSTGNRVSGDAIADFIAVDSDSYAYYEAIHVTDADGAAWDVENYETSEFGQESA